MKKDLTLPARILISILFFVSAIAKMIDFTWTKGFSKTIWMFEKQLVDLENFPLMNKERFTDPTRHIEQSASSEWIRGGVPSREIYKNKDYKNTREI